MGTITGTIGADELIGTSSDDAISGLEGDDTIVGGSGLDTLNGGAGNDLIISSSVGAVIEAGDGNDQVQISGLRSGPTTVTLGGGSDVLVYTPSLGWTAPVIVTDFHTDDRLAVQMDLVLPGWDPSIDPLSAGYIRLIQAGADVVVQVDTDGPGSAATFVDLLRLQNVQVSVLTAGDTFGGSPGGGFGGGGSGGQVPTAGADNLSATGMNTEVHAGAGDDTITAGDAPTYMRGDEGNDVIIGGSAFDDANGNMGNDTVATGAGDDWAVGGKDNDSLSGGAGSDVVWGNLGNDTQDGGEGNDQVRGGQGDDTITGGGGDDFVSGDRGNDTIAGGAGADLFHGSQDAGIDRVVDFRASDGDRVFLDPGTTYTVSQVGADTVVDMGGGHQMILVGVTMSSLPAGWIFGA